jgi:hypothetical protein
MKRNPRPDPAVPQKPGAFVELRFIRYVRTCDGILFADFTPSYRQQRDAPGRPSKWRRRQA